jgi:hypothetical protein
MGRPADWRSSVGVAARRALPFLAMSILYFLGLFAGFFVVVVGAVFLFVRWSVAIPALVLERRGPAAALGRSWNLVSGFWWKCFGTLFVAYSLLIVLSVAFAALLGALLAAVTGIDSVLGLAAQQVVDVAVQLLTLPLLAAVTVVLYVDLRVRKEGFDLALAADRIAGRTAPASFPPARQSEPAFGE